MPQKIGLPMSWTLCYFCSKKAWYLVPHVVKALVGIFESMSHLGDTVPQIGLIVQRMAILHIS